MPKPTRLLILLAGAAPLALAACDKPDNAPGPGGVSMGEARALDRAAEIIEERRVEVAPPAEAGAPNPAPQTETAPAPEQQQAD